MDILPVRAGALGATDISDADVYLHRFNCTYPRALLQLGLEGAYDFLDGFVFLNGCEQLRRVYDIWKQKINTPFMGMVTIPHARGKDRLKWYVDDMKKLVDDIQMKWGLALTPAKLAESITDYNRYRELMMELYSLRESEKPLLTGSEAMRILNASFNMPKKVLNEKLALAIAELKQRPGITNIRARLMLGGGYMDDTFTTDIIENQGALVVTDCLCFGKKYIEDPIKIDPNQPTLEAIAERYFYHNPCPRMMDTYKQRCDRVVQQAKDTKVDGVVFQRLSFCDCHGVECQMNADDLEAAGIPYLILEKMYMPTDEGRLKTRVQAFLEKLGK
jgi:benzoyl-CoA reductase subunit C